MKGIRFSNPAGEKKIHSMLLLSITLCTVFTMLLSSYIYYVNYSKISLNQVYHSDLGNLMQTSKEVVNMTDSAQALAFQMYQNSVISKMMYYPELNIYDQTAGMTELSNYLMTMPFIESIYVYNAKSGLFFISSNRGQNGYFTKNELADTDILNVLEHFQEYKPFTPIPRSYAARPSDARKSGVYTYLCFDAIGRDQAMNSAVIVNISAAWINKDFGKSGGADPGITYILDNRGRILAGDSLSPVATEDAGKALQALLTSNVKSREAGYLVTEAGGVKSLISYTSPDTLGWQYIRITPYKHITKQIDSVRTATFGIAGVILLAGLLASWSLSRLLYIPIRRIVHKMNTLEKEVRNHLYPLKQSMLRRVVRGTRPAAEEGAFR
ncbi:cache domain-containing protein [Paenibacillus sp. P25]|nr:cache domain-containing protein [Paenibacillus sp. P25]